MEAETFYFLVSFWFDDKSEICMGETVPYIIDTQWNETWTEILVITYS